MVPVGAFNTGLANFSKVGVSTALARRLYLRPVFARKRGRATRLLSRHYEDGEGLDSRRLALGALPRGLQGRPEPVTALIVREGDFCGFIAGLEGPFQVGVARSTAIEPVRGAQGNSAFRGVSAVGVG